MPVFPTLSSLSFRHMRGEEDIPAMLAVHDACRERDRIDLHSVCYTIPNLTPESYARLVREAPPNATLLAEENGKLVAHAWMEVWGVEERCYLWGVWVAPEWRGQGLGTAMLHWGEAKARELHGDDARPGLHLANTTEGESDATALLYNESYYLSFISPELAFDAFATLPIIPVVPGITLRPLEEASSRLVARALSEINLNPPGNGTRWTDDDLERRIDAEEHEWIERVHSSEPLLSPIAWDGNTIVGAYLCRRKGQVGEIAQVGVKENWRGRGIARALAMHSLHGLKDAGCVTARLFTSIGPEGTEPTSGPYVMYRKFGFMPIARHLRFRKPMTML